MTSDLTNIVDLGIGHAEDIVLPLEELKNAANHRLSLPDKAFLQYGPEEGSLSFRTKLAGFLSKHYKTLVCEKNLLITAGASHGLDLILNKLGRAGDTVFVEDPTYFFALDIFRDRKVNVVPIATDQDGLDIDALESQLKLHKPAFLYTIPMFQNPTGAILPAERRRRLVELARRHDFLIIADEVYQLLGNQNELPLPLPYFDDERVLSLGSFSKILGPGIRIGWIQCSSKHIEILRSCGVLLSGGVSPLTAAILESAIELGIQDQYLSQIRSLYDSRRIFMTSLLGQTLPEEVTFVPPKGGFFIWLTLPRGLDAARLSQEAVSMNINFKPGSACSCRQNFSNCLRLCFTFYGEEKLLFACERLSKLLQIHIERESACTIQ